MMMILRCNRLNAPILLAYLSAIAGGGLHHHEHDSAFSGAVSGDSRSMVAQSQIRSSSPAVSTCEDETCCTLCTALHQAKALLIAIPPTNGITPVGAARVLPFESPNTSVYVVQQARAPPAL